MTDLRAILQERRQGFAADIDKAEGEMRAVQRAIGHLSAHIAEIDFVLVQLDTPSIPAPAAPAPPEKAPRELCAEAILEAYEGRDLPAFVDEFPANFARTYGARTLRAGLNLAHERKESRAGLEGDASTERDTCSPPPSSQPVGAGSPFRAGSTDELPPPTPPAASVGVGAGTVPDMPSFLRRAKAAAE